MATIDTKEQFGQVYTDLLSSHNYRGLVDLLSNTNFNTDESRYRAKVLIEQFTEQADIEDKILEGADDKLKNSYNFITSGPSSSKMSDESSPDYKFMTAWNNLSDGDNPITIKFPSEEIYDNFINSFNGDISAVIEKGITLGPDYSIKFNKDIEDKVGVYNAIANSGIKEHFQNRIIQSAYYEPGIARTRGTEYVLSEQERNLFNQLTTMDSVTKEANSDYEKLLSNVTPYINEMVVSGYMGEDDKQLQQALANGMIELNVFKEMRSVLEEKYNRVLQTKSLSQYDVWSMDEDNKGSQVLQKLDDPLLKNELDIEINNAIADGRLHFSHASNGIDIGTMIVIDQARDKNGKPISDSKPRRIFVKDLFRSQAENALRDDTQTAAQMQYAKHQTYKHTYRGADGSTITDWDQARNSAVYTKRNGFKSVVGKAEILDIIDDDIIAKRMIDYYENANTTDKNGNGYTQEYYKVYGNNGFNSTTLYNNISAKCLAAIASKYNGQSEDFIKYKAQELISTVLKGLGVDFEVELNDTNGTSITEAFLRNRGANIK